MSRKILVVNMNYMGDALLTTPALSALRQTFPDAQLDTIVGAGAPTEVLRDNPDLNRVIPRQARGSLARCVELYRLLRGERYTDVIFLPPLPAYAITAWLARTPNRIGQSDRGMNFFLTQKLPTRAVHMADAMLDTMPVPAAARSDRHLTVALSPEDRAGARALLAAVGLDDTRPLLAVNLGATRPQKRWFAAAFAAAIDLLDGVQCVLIGAGPDDAALADQVQALTKRSRPINLVGRTGVKQLAALLERCDALLTADSGPMHLATAVSTPTVALFGSTDPAVTGPYDRISRVLFKNLPCAPCFSHPTCGGRYDCMRQITPEEAALSVREVLRERHPARQALPMASRAEASASSVAALTPPAPSLHPATEALRLGAASGRGGARGEVGIKTPAPAGEAEIKSSSLAPPLPQAGEGAGGVRAATDEAEEAKASSTSASPRILIVTKFRFIGDTLLAIPIFRAARTQWPNARLVLLTGRNARVLLQNNPYLDEIIEFDPNRRDRGAKPFAALIKRLRRERFDLCLTLNRSFHSALIPWLAGVGTRAGFCSEGRSFLLNRRIPYEYDGDKSEVACYFDVLRAVAPAVSVQPALELWISPDEEQDAAERLRVALGGEVVRTRLIGIQPGASQSNKRWPTEQFAQVAAALAAHDPEARLVLLGGPDERETGAAMWRALTPETRARTVDFVGQLDLRASLALVSRLGLLLGNDTAVMHSAVALGVPTVALFGPTNPRKWGSDGPGHRVLESPDGTMSGIALADVVAAVCNLRAPGSACVPALPSGIIKARNGQHCP